MRAFSLYPGSERNLRQLLAKLEPIGKINCDFDTFCKLHNDWHRSRFPGQPVNTSAVCFRDDWFTDFVNYIANADI